MNMRPVESLCVGDLVRFTPDLGLIDKVVSVRMRLDREFPDDAELAWVTVTHETGCWSKHPGELVEIVEGNPQI